ncbi:hypothetical protein [Dactylosporangium sp. NPDC048998]|uniref:hypothetical protein n=1 Tax=Dactylosporangium sp. NPDC048998 TaxID=3363976 RepID=UPI00371392E2
MKLPRSSLHGLLRVLAERGYLFVDPDSRVYRIGARRKTARGGGGARRDAATAVRG